MEIDILHHWFSRVQQIIDQRRKVAAITGDNFNIFRILSLDASEVRLHSALLAELLDPRGSHGQGDTYLKVFIEQLEIKGYDTKSSVSEVEKHIGFICPDGTTGGRIDIVLTDKNKRQIFIENKIHAFDQDNQLLRYHNYNKIAHIIYLTLKGDLASENSTGKELNEKFYTTLSYKSDIIRWLVECRNNSSCLPFIRETLSQYISLLKILTNQAESDIMNQEIIEFIVGNPALVESIDKCSQALAYIVTETNQRFKKKMDDHFSNHENVINVDGYEIKCSWGEDCDGVHYGYLLYDGDTNISSSHFAKKYSQILLEINDQFHTGGLWIGWKNASGFSRYMRFAGLDRHEIIKMYKNSEDLDALVSNIVSEELQIRESFKEKINKAVAS